MAGERPRELERFITFLDAIVAIAITLLVLPLVELTGEVGHEDSVADLLRDNQAELWAFLLSFAVISRFWFIQHTTLTHVVRFDRRFCGLLMVWALSIVFLPFPTALVAEAPANPLTKVLYMGTMAVTMLALAAAEAYLRRHPSLTDGDPEGDIDALGGLVNAGLVLVALGISLAVPATSYFPLVLLGAAGRLTTLLRR